MLFKEVKKKNSVYPYIFMLTGSVLALKMCYIDWTFLDLMIYVFEFIKKYVFKCRIKPVKFYSELKKKEFALAT